MDESNMAIFPSSTGSFNTFELTSRAHYEVNGEVATADASTAPPPAPSPTPFAGATQRFSFSRPSAAAGSPAASAPPRAVEMTRSFQRSIFIADLVNAKLRPSRMVVIRFMESEATVQGILSKVQDALGSYDPLMLTDAQGNEILDSEGTRGSIYWKQNARKVLAVAENEFVELQSGKRRRSSRKEDETAGLQDIYEKIEEVILAAQSLPEVTLTIKTLSELAISERVTYILTEAQAEHV
ncbi:uncharacterized protein LOC130094927 [Rhinichthys klamathensis goyatoka]|uniref:uncharacterized protein LOC130094927 n=1 Tax=Rhinichthys klamathensis goyatoka TaxID=3034132 RepID=UPI0024B503C6|nr:uncharacterized protein LOC130094927 [Rhinichthys klamathensis goyatoka]